MISHELIKKIRRIEIFTKKAVEETLAGNYHSVFKGLGMEFFEVRQYVPGDDIRLIDWNVTARAGEPYVKLFIEERELTVILAVDFSASGRFGSFKHTKNETSAEICALLAFSAIKNNDKVGLLAFTDRVELFIPPAKDTTHVLKIVRDVLTFQPKGKGTKIISALSYLNKALHRKSVIFLISDFIDENYEHELALTARKHDLICMVINDHREFELPAIGIIALEDAETNDVIFLDTDSIRSRYSSEAKVNLSKLRSVFTKYGIDHIEITAGTDYVPELIKLFKMRQLRLTGKNI